MEISDKEYEKWLGLRNKNMDEFGEKLCYCGHTDFCSCANPSLDLFKESIKRGVLDIKDLSNGWKNGNL